MVLELKWILHVCGDDESASISNEGTEGTEHTHISSLVD